MQICRVDPPSKFAPPFPPQTEDAADFPNNRKFRQQRAHAPKVGLAGAFPTFRAPRLVFSKITIGASGAHPAGNSIPPPARWPKKTNFDESQTVGISPEKRHYAEDGLIGASPCFRDWSMNPPKSRIPEQGPPGRAAGALSPTKTETQQDLPNRRGLLRSSALTPKMGMGGGVLDIPMFAYDILKHRR